MSHFYMQIVLLPICLFLMSNGEKLGKYNVDPAGISVSGFSSGGAMSMQFHFVYSSYFKGAGVFAGSPYLCGGNYLLCLVTPGLIDVNVLIGRANKYSEEGLIDDLISLTGKKVFIYHGQKDTSNGPANGRKIQEMYEHYNASIKVNFEIDAQHGMPTDNYGAECGESSQETEYITNCNYNGAFKMLDYIYDENLTAPTSSEVPLKGELIQFEQSEFFANSSAISSSMNETGYIYVPSGCKSNSTKLCKLHVVFHGCSQYSGMIDDIYVTKTGYLEVAEVNDIIVLFPQTITSSILTNPGGCWDTWGYVPSGDSNGNFGTKNGSQDRAVFAMLERLTKG